jgi:hypothetical protein
LRALPAGVLNATLKLERRISREGMMSVGGKFFRLQRLIVQCKRSARPRSPTAMDGVVLLPEQPDRFAAAAAHQQRNTGATTSHAG